jgi:trigger factor
MQVSVETMGGLERRLKISVEAESFESEITTKLKETSRRIKLPGFRPGKVPLKEVRRRFGPAVRAEVAQEIMQSSYMDAVNQEELSPAGAPELDIVNIDIGADLEFTATFEIFPSIEIADLSGVKIKQPVAEVQTEDLETMISRLQEQRKEWIDLDQGSKSEQGHRITVDFVGKMDGEEFEGGTGQEIQIEIGSGQMIEDLEKGLIGLSAEESVTIPVTFPDDYQADNLKGKAAEFEVSVKKLEEPKIPPLDESFFKLFGVDDDDVEAFRAKIRENMENEVDQSSKGQVKRQVMDQLFELHDFSTPKALIERECDVLRDQMMQQLQMPVKPDSDPLPSELFKDEAEKRVRVGLIINEIVSAENLSADSDKVRERIETIAQPYDQPEQIINFYYGNEQQLQQVEMAVLEDTVIDHVLAQVNVEKLSSNYDDVVSGAATAPELKDEGEERLGDDQEEPLEKNDPNLEK